MSTQLHNLHGQQSLPRLNRLVPRQTLYIYLPTEVKSPIYLELGEIEYRVCILISALVTIRNDSEFERGNGQNNYP